MPQGPKKGPVLSLWLGPEGSGWEVETRRVALWAMAYQYVHEVRSSLTGRSTVDTGCFPVRRRDLRLLGFTSARFVSPPEDGESTPRKEGSPVTAWHKCCPKRQKLLLHMTICRANLCSYGEQVSPWRLIYATAVELSVFIRTCCSWRNCWKCFSARNTAQSFKTFMWAWASLGSHMPFTALPIRVALHANRNASVVMVILDDTAPSRTPAVKVTVSLLYTRRCDFYSVAEVTSWAQVQCCYLTLKIPQHHWSLSFSVALDRRDPWWVHILHPWHLPYVHCSDLRDLATRSSHLQQRVP